MFFLLHNTTERFHYRQMRDLHRSMIVQLGLILFSVVLITWYGGAAVGAEKQLLPITTMSAASYDGRAVAPGSIVTSFGVVLATTTVSATDINQNLPGIQLPTSLGGTTVEVNGRLAGLLFVSPAQINYILPPETEVGIANVVVHANDGAVSSGTVPVQRVAPGIFCANSSGRGVPAAEIQRVRGGAVTSEVPFQCNGGNCVAKPIDLGPEGDVVVLMLYLTGLRNAPDPNGDGNANETVRVLLGGRELVPEYAGAQPSFAGLDQINVRLPRELADSGQVSLTVTAPGSASNAVELLFNHGGAITIEPFGANAVVAGQVVAIRGSGFSANREKNLVRLPGADGQTEAQVVDATPTQLTILLPFGARTGFLTVSNLEMGGTTGFSSSLLRIQTSLSGFVKDTAGRKLKGATVTVKDTGGPNRTALTNGEGVFVIPDLAPGLAEVTVDGATVSGARSYPKITFRTRIGAEQDNQLSFPGSLQEINGPSGNLSTDGQRGERALGFATLRPSAEPQGRITNGQVALDIPDSATIRFPDGTPVSRVTLSLVERSLTPVPLPERQFSSTIVQISPIGAVITPGAKLTFPNSDGFPAGSEARLFRLDQQPNSATPGQFIDAGAAVVSNDGRLIETAVGAVTETTDYFVSVPRQTVTVVGNVVEIDQVPVRRAILAARGQGGFTDGNGGFVVRNVPLNSVLGGVESILIEANYLRPTKVVSRREREVAPGQTGNVTSAGVLVLDPPPSDDPPLITAPTSFRVFAGQTQSIEIVVSRGGQAVDVTLTGVSFATLTPLGNDAYRITLAPGLNDRGTYTLVITAVSDLGRIATHRLALTVQ